MGCSCCKGKAAENKVTRLTDPVREPEERKNSVEEIDPNLCLKLKTVVCQVRTKASFEKYQCFLLFSDADFHPHSEEQKTVFNMFEEDTHRGSVVCRKKGEKTMICACVASELANFDTVLKEAFLWLLKVDTDTLVLLYAKSLGSDTEFLTDNSISVFNAEFIKFCKKVPLPRVVDIVSDVEKDLAGLLRYEMCARE